MSTPVRKIVAEFEIDEAKAVGIAKLLQDLFYGGKGFFSGYSMPEYILPRNLVEGSKEHALYLTYVISIDYMTDAEKLWKKSRGAHELYPERFQPEAILSLSDRTIEAFVRQLGARFASSGAKAWKKISQILLNDYTGDPREITREPLTIEQVKDRLAQFPYLRGGKLSNFYIRAMAERKLLKIKNLNELDVPVDKQVARFTAYTGVLSLVTDKFQGCVNDDPLRSIIEEVWRNAAKTINTYPWKLDEPIWTIGSKLCAIRKCSKCPVENYCDKTRGITFRENTIFWKRMP